MSASSSSWPRSPLRWGLAAEVDIDHVAVGLDRASVINCDALHTITQASLTGPLGRVEDDVMRRVCSAVSYALGC